MLIKIVALLRNLLISSFDASIGVNRAFHPGFASHVHCFFYIYIYIRTSNFGAEAERYYIFFFCDLRLNKRSLMFLNYMVYTTGCFKSSFRFVFF